MKSVKVLIVALFFFFFAISSLFAMSNSEATAIMELRFKKISRIYAKKRAELTKKEKDVAEDILGIASKLVSKKRFKEADALLDELKLMLEGKASFFLSDENRARKKKFRVKKMDIEADEILNSKHHSDANNGELTAVSFTLEEAFKSREEKLAEKVKKYEEESENSKEPPKIIPFKLENLSKIDQKRYKILGTVLPEVESTFKLHPNPETAEAMKEVRRYFYYLKKKGMGFPVNPKTEEDLKVFMREKITNGE